MNVLGQILLWGGFLSGSLATVLNLEKKIAWSTIPWGWYIGSVIICIIGIVLLRIGKKSAAESSHESTASLAEIRASVVNLINHTEQLRGQMDEMAPSEMVAFIDDVLAPDFYTFAEGRNAITAEMGLQKFADVMTHFSAGERAINRAWSAAADGYVDEATTCVKRGLAMLHDAQQELG
ncbi:MAG: hypothetical protein P8K79_12460 [Mariniblastus sp.]|nr:hypothetical protein [Mariniblastus sp.]